MRRLAIVLGALGLVVAGPVAAHALITATAGTVHTATSCTSTTAATHTDAMDGTAVATVGGETLSVCATATATDQTTTLTGPTTTATTTVGTTTPTTAVTTTTAPPPNYLFADEFNGAAGSLPSSTLWGVKTGSSNGSAHWNGWSQVSEDGNGNLAITAQKINGVWQSAFISGKVAYSGSYRQEVRAKLACGQGVWNAPLWSWGAPYGASPSIEVDGNEQLGGKNPAGEYHATLHNWNGATNPQSGVPITTNSTLCDGFHVYADDVHPDRVDFYLDGTLEASIPASAVGLTDLSTWREVSNIDLNMGGWAGTIGSETSVTMLVDYVRVTPLG